MGLGRFCSLLFGALWWNYQTSVSIWCYGSGVMNLLLICWYVAPYYHYERLMNCKSVQIETHIDWIQRRCVCWGILNNFNQSILRWSFQNETRTFLLGTGDRPLITTQEFKWKMSCWNIMFLPLVQIYIKKMSHSVNFIRYCKYCELNIESTMGKMRVAWRICLQNQMSVPN